MITAEQIERFHTAASKLRSLHPGLRSVLSGEESEILDIIIAEVHAHTILDHIAAALYEAADATEDEARDWFLQQASTVSAAALFCKTWEPNK